MLANLHSLVENYESLRQKNPYDLGLKMAQLHYQIGATARAQELVGWIIKKAKSPLIKLQAITMQHESQLRQNMGYDAKLSLQQIHAIMLGGLQKVGD